MGTELELKYAAADRTVLDRIVARYTGPWQETAMESCYYDTEDGALQQRRWTLRRRREGGISVICVKTPGTAESGVPARGEWEWRGDSVQEALPHLVAAGAPAELLAVTEGRTLAVVCGARFLRRAVRIQLEASELELAADNGVLCGGGREEPLCEVEAEHKSGDPAATAAFASDLARRFGLHPEPESKFRRALSLAEQSRR